MISEQNAAFHFCNYFNTSIHNNGGETIALSKAVYQFCFTSFRIFVIFAMNERSFFAMLTFTDESLVD